MLFLDQVILVSTVPTDSPSFSPNTYKHIPQNSRPNPHKSSASSSINAGRESLGQMYQLELLGGSDTFGVKVTPFTYKDASIPTKCLTSFSSRDFLSNGVGSSFSQDTNLLAFHPTLSALFVYGAGKDRPVSRSFGHERLNVLQASPCGRFLLAGTESGCLILWRIGSGDLVSVIEGAHFQAIRVIKFSADGQCIATGSSDALIKIWSWSNFICGSSSRPEPIFTFAQHSAPITDLVFSLTCIGRGCAGRLLSASLDGKCNLYDLTDGQLLFQLNIPTGATAVAMNATETCIHVAGIDGNIYPIQLNGSYNTSTVPPVALQFHKGPISSLQWSMDERVLISCGFEDGQVSFWDGQSHQLLKSLQLSSKKVACTNILVIGKSDPILSNNLSCSSSTFSPFKRVGNPLVSISTASTILPISKEEDENVSDASKEKLKDLIKENEELRSINSELCSMVCDYEKVDNLD